MSTATAAIEAMRAQAVPCVRIVAGDAGRSRIGGLPHLGPGFVWPSRDGRNLSFLAQIDLAEVRMAEGHDWLPDRGTLAFFYDEEDGAWGFSPEDRGSCVVLYDSGSPADAKELAPPTPAPNVYFAQSVQMLPHMCLPSPERAGIEGWDLDDAAWQEINDFVHSTEGDDLRHQIGGWPYPIQNDGMELESQLASNGIDCGGSEGYSSDAAKALAPGAAEWRLLLQLDSDDASEMMWGDSGILYFWVREEDARAADFSNVWMILQCC